MAEVPAFLTKQIGPLPVAGWAAVGAGGVGLGLLARKYFGGSDQVTYSSSPANEYETAGGTNLDTAGATAGGAGYYSGGTGGDVSRETNTAPKTNEEWRELVGKLLRGSGFTVAAVDTAVNKYLLGQQLTDDEYSVINSAILVGGTTPEATAPITRMPTTVTQPNPTAPAMPATPVVLPKINSADWGETLAGGIVSIGSAGPGGWFQGKTVQGGAPIYAFINGKWRQNFDWNKLAPGTDIGTPGQLSSYINNDNVTADFTP